MNYPERKTSQCIPALINLYYKKVKQRFPTKTDFIKNLFQFNKKKIGRFEIKSDNVHIANNKQMFAVKL